MLKRFNAIYYALNYTWGIFMNLCGAVYSIIFCIMHKCKPFNYHGRFVFVGGDNWGAVSLGNFIFMSNQSFKRGSTIKHELGHSLQNAIWGPLFLFAIGIPSITRAAYRSTSAYKEHPEKYTDYDSIWFEGQATRWGNTYIEKAEDVAIENT